MLKQACGLCKVVGLIAILGILNWTAAGLLNTNFVEQIFGVGTMLTKIVYGLVGLSGLALLASFFIVCPVCKKA